jgi:hypothetical protein
VTGDAERCLGWVVWWLSSLFGNKMWLGVVVC